MEFNDLGIQIVEGGGGDSIRIIDTNTPNAQKVTRDFQRFSYGFCAPPDSLMLYFGMLEAVRVAGRLIPETSVRILDLGCNSMVGGLNLLKQKRVEAVAGIEINGEAVDKGREAARQFGIEGKQYQFLNSDLNDLNAIRFARRFGPSIIAANLPYLPQSKDLDDTTVDAGLDGTKFVPNIILHYAQLTQAPILTFNFSSLTSPDRVFERVKKSDYVISEALLLAINFGKYTRKLYEQGVISDTQKYWYHRDGETCTQCVINLVLSEKLLGGEKVTSSKVLSILNNFTRTGEITLRE